MELFSESNRGNKPVRVPDILSRDEQRAMLAVPNRKKPTGQRNHALLSIFLNTGLRLSEALDLKAGDLEMESGRLTVRQGKGGRDRVLWLQDEDVELIKNWLKERPAESDYVFCTLKGRRMNERYVRDVIKRCAEKSGLTKNVYPHLLRHTFATDMLNKTSNIRLVQKALGHSSIITTMIYTHVADKQLESAMKGLRKD